MCWKKKRRDNKQLRLEIESLFMELPVVEQSKWSISLSKHLLERIGVDYKNIPEIVDGFESVLKWESFGSNIYEIRNAAFTIQNMVRKYKDDTMKIAIRMVGYAISTGDRPEHGLLASNYAIDVIDAITKSNIEEITNEREWQLNELKKYL